MVINSDQIWDGDTIAWSFIKNSNLCAEPERKKKKKKKSEKKERKKKKEEEKEEQKRKKEKRRRRRRTQKKEKNLWETMERNGVTFFREWPKNNTQEAINKRFLN